MGRDSLFTNLYYQDSNKKGNRCEFRRRRTGRSPEGRGTDQRERLDGAQGVALDFGRVEGRSSLRYR